MPTLENKMSNRRRTWCARHPLLTGAGWLLCGLIGWGTVMALLLSASHACPSLGGVSMQTSPRWPNSSACIYVEDHAIPPPGMIVAIDHVILASQCWEPA
jgi:hypothetical protein